MTCRCGGDIAQEGNLFRCKACHAVAASMLSLRDALVVMEAERKLGPIDPEFGVVTHRQPWGLH